MNTTTSTPDEILLHILRIGLIQIRTIAARPKRDKTGAVMLAEWSQLCHTLPSLLLGECRMEGLRYFLASDGASFQKAFPVPTDVSFTQVVGLLQELSAWAADEANAEE